MAILILEKIQTDFGFHSLGHGLDLQLVTKMCVGNRAVLAANLLICPQLSLISLKII